MGYGHWRSTPGGYREAQGRMAEDHLQGYPIVKEQSLSWGDMDVHGHVNNVWFFRYIENARVAYFEAIDKYGYEESSGDSFILAHTSCKFLSPLVYPDVVRVGACVSSILKDRAVMSYRVVSSSRNRIAAEAEATIVAFDYSKDGKIPFPEELKRRIQELEKRTF